MTGNTRGDAGLAVESAAWSQAWCPTDQLDPATTNEADYRANLLRISSEMGTGFLDLTGIWGEYMILAQGGSVGARVVDATVYDGYFRDPIHANTFGKELLGRTLATAFTPLASISPTPVPEPGGWGLLAAAAGLAALLAAWRWLSPRSSARRGRRSAA